MGDVVPFPSRPAWPAGVDDEAAAQGRRLHPSERRAPLGFTPSRPGRDVSPADTTSLPETADAAANPAHAPATPAHAVRPRETAPEGVDPLWRELIGHHLRGVRHQHGLRLKDVAERAGVSPQYLSEVERGLKDPSSELLAAIAGALGLGILDLVSDIVAAPVTPVPTCHASSHLVLVV